MKGTCQVKTVAYSVALPGPTNAPINWQNVELSNQLEMVDIQSGAIDPRIINLIGAISQQHTITISALRSDHSRYTSSGNVSNHYYGRAMDIAAIDGVSCTQRLAGRALRDARPPARRSACRAGAHRADLLLGPRRPGEPERLRPGRPLRPHPRRIRRLAL